MNAPIRSSSVVTLLSALSLIGPIGCSMHPATSVTSSSVATMIPSAGASSSTAATTMTSTPKSPQTPASRQVPGCVSWPDGVSDLATSIANNSCVQVSPGSYWIDSQIVVPSNHQVIGSGRDVTILEVSPNYIFGAADAVFATTAGTTGVQISNLSIDGAGLATYLVGFQGMTVSGTRLANGRCSAVGIGGPGMVIDSNIMTGNSQPTNNALRGHVGCETVPDGLTAASYGGVALGAAIAGLGIDGVHLGEVGGMGFAPQITNNDISGSYGPALDNCGVWFGIFAGNNVHDNAGWAAVSLYGSSYWQVTGNTISQPADQSGQPYHPDCARGPVGSHSAGIFLCEDTTDNNFLTNFNLIANNQTSGFYGILSVGAVNAAPYVVPRLNTFQNNNVVGSSFGCADDFAPGQWFTDTDLWSGNNCDGTPNSQPTYF